MAWWRQLLSTLLLAGGSIACSEGFIMRRSSSTGWNHMQTHVVYGRADDASGGRRAGRKGSRHRFRLDEPAVYSFVVVGNLPPQVAEALEENISRAGASRGIRDDRGGASDVLQSLAARRAPFWIGGAARRAGSGGHERASGDLLARGETGEVVILRGEMSPPVTRTIRRPTKAPSRTAGSAPATWGGSMPTGIFFLPDASRKSSTAAARKSLRAKLTKCCWIIRPSRPPSPSPCPTPASAKRLPPPSSFARIMTSSGRQSLMQFAAQRLADFKVPRRILILGEIPKGPTGKPQRIGLAKRLGVDQRRCRLCACCRSADERPLSENETALGAHLV